MSATLPIESQPSALRWSRPDLVALMCGAFVPAFLAHLAGGELSTGLLHARRIIPVLLFPLLFLLSVLFVIVVTSLVRMRHFIDPTTKFLDVRSLWRSVWVNPLPGVSMALVAGYGITGCTNLVEIYRARTTIFHDAALWHFEAPLIEGLLASPLNVPLVWDRIYFSLWLFLFLVVAQLYCAGRHDAVVRFLLGAVIAFYLTRVIVLFYPSAGPVFFRPEAFALDGTTSAGTQQVLRLYMAGKIPQNGLLPGTTAMPSLHVGLVALGVGLLGREYPRTLRWSLPWLGITWASTVFLGWHYALDGVGGIALVAVALWIAVQLLRLTRSAWPAADSAGKAAHP